MYFFFSSRRRHTRWPRDWSSDVCSSDLSRAAERCFLLSTASAARDLAEDAATLLRNKGGVLPLEEGAAVSVTGSGAKEIGRASCREREKMEAVPESVKKKTIEKITSKSI